MDFDVLIGGDLVPTDSNEKEFQEGTIRSLIEQNLWDVITSAEFRIFNLETPITDTKNPIEKEGPKLRAKASTIKGIKALNTDLVTLANNHILDQEEQGIQSTIDNLNQYEIAYVGGGYNLNEASKPYIVEKNGLRIGVYACSQHEYTIATDSKGGANPFEPLDSLDHIAELSSKCDYTLVLYHGGREFYRYPTPYLQKVCRKMIEKGANIVICQHSHCIGCYEDYNRGTIVYGQGNFLFDLEDPVNEEFYQTSLIVKLSFHESLQISYIPIRKAGKGIQLAVNEDEKEILGSFYRRSEQIMEKGFIENKYEELAKQKGSRYLLRYSKIGDLLSVIDMKLLNGKMFDRSFGCLFTKRQKRTIENSLQCEVHRELLLKYLQLQADELRRNRK
jgi:poly-gamma-glutamate synthesis protein (capsule biosynthesis protein)